MLRELPGLEVEEMSLLTSAPTFQTRSEISTNTTEPRIRWAALFKKALGVPRYRSCSPGIG